MELLMYAIIYTHPCFEIEGWYVSVAEFQIVLTG